MQDEEKEIKEEDKGLSAKEDVQTDQVENSVVEEAQPTTTEENLQTVETEPSVQIKPEEIIIEKIGNKTIERKGDTVTITEIMEPQIREDQKDTPNTKSPTPPQQANLWQRFLQKVGLSKERKLAKILKLLEKQQKITNDDVEKLLHISDATATRYLDQLEKSGQIRQIGKVGHAVYYEKI